jgi:Ca-activated chloride channel homolog
MLRLRSIPIALSALLVILSIGSTAQAQRTGKVQVTVLDDKTGQPLVRASVSLQEVKKGAFTKDDGTATIINVPHGAYTLVIKSVTYTEKRLPIVLKDSLLRLTERLVRGSMDTVIVLESRPVVEKSRTEQSRKFSASELDAITLTPGVSSGDARSYQNGASIGAGGVLRPQADYYGQEEYKSMPETGYKFVTAEPLSTFSIDVDRASYANIRRFLTEGSLPPKDAVRVEEMLNYFHYDLPSPRGDDPVSIFTDMAACPWNEKHRVVQVALKGREIETDKLPPANLVFLIDVSGSMNNAKKLPLLKSAFRLLVEQLREEDKVAIVTYAGNAGLVLPATSGDQKAKILSAIDNLTPGGSTAGAAGIQLAYEIAKQNMDDETNSRVILATDGDFNVGVSGDDELVKLIESKRDEGIFLTVFGFGTGNYKDSKMEQLADKGNGNYAYCDNLLEAQKVFVKEIGGTLTTIAKDVKIQIEFNPKYVQAYRLIGYENRRLNKEDFNDDKKDAGELGAGHEVTALYEIIPVGVQSDALVSVDPLKYQRITKTNVEMNDSDELMTVKLRYKEPKGSKSKLITQAVKHNESLSASENLRFSMAVAQFGMLLSESSFKGSSDMDEVIKLASSAQGTDKDGYRAECIRLMETYKLLGKSRSYSN